MRAIKFAAILAAFLLPAISSSAGAEQGGAFAESCQPATDFVERLTTAEHVAAHLKGPQAARFMEVYNAVPPKTGLVADEILILTKDGVPDVAVLRFIAGCFQDYGVHPAKLADWVLRNALGQSL